MNPGFNNNRIDSLPNTNTLNTPYNGAARVLDSGALGIDNHFVSINAGEQPVMSMSIIVPRAVNAIDDIIITDSSGDRIAANTSLTNNRVMVNFAQPLNPGEDVRVMMSGVQLTSPIARVGGILEYFVDVMPQGFTQPIPLGYTRVILHDRTDSNDN